MRLCMMPLSIFVSRLGITNLVNKIKFYTISIKLFNLKFISFCFSLEVLSKYDIIFGNITWINIFINSKDTVMRICMFSFSLYFVSWIVISNAEFNSNNLFKNKSLITFGSKVMIKQPYTVHQNPDNFRIEHF